MKIQLVSDATEAPALSRIPYTACPLCEGTAWLDILEQDCRRHPLHGGDLPPMLGWKGCETCGHLFTEGYFDAESAQRLAQRAQLVHLPGEGDIEAERRSAARLVHRVSELRGAIAGAWLDVGTGSGALVTTAAEFGYDTAGLDTNVAVVERLKAFGYEAGLAPIEELEGEDAFDVISFDGSLVRYPFPGQALAAAARLLRPGGVLFVSMPNVDSFSWKQLDARNENPFWSELSSFHNFSREHLYWLLRKQGFEPCDFAISERNQTGMEVCAALAEDLA